MTHLAKIAMLGITLALATSAAQAQTKSTNANADDDGTVPQPLGLRTVVGCVSRTAGTYVITGGAPGPKQFRIVSGDVSSLESRMGYTVKVVGIVSKNDPLANQNDLYNEGSTTGVGYLTIDAQSVSQVYANCSEPGKEWAGQHK